MPEPLLIARNATTECQLLPGLANHHGLITGATGTGKTVTLQTLAERHPGTAGVALAPDHDRGFAKEIQIGHGHPGPGFAPEQVRNRGFNLLPRHVRRQHHQRVTQIDHVVDARAEEIVGGGARRT
jgi:hypothetical protein